MDPEHKEHKSVQEQDTQEEDEVGFDFTLGKNKLKSKKDTKQQYLAESENKNEQEIEFDIKQFYKKHAKWVIPVLLIFIAIGFSTYLRVMPAYLPVTDSWATQSVENFYKTQIEQQVSQQYPNLVGQNKQGYVQRQFESVRQSDEFKAQVAQTSKQFKAQMQDDTGQTYLLAIDPYHWYVFARNYVNYGTLGDSQNEKGEQIVSTRNGRIGSGITKIAFHPIATAWIFNIVQIFNKDVSLMAVLFFMPVLIIGLSLIPAFLIGRRVAGNLAGFVAALIIAINTSLLARTPAGFSDTDPYNIFFPLLISWLVLESHYAKDRKNKVILGVLAGFTTGLYAVSWLGYWYIFLLLVAALVGYFLYLFVGDVAKRRKCKIKDFLTQKQSKDVLLEIGSYIVSSAIFVSLFAGFSRFIFLLKAPLKIINLKEVGVTSLWPNVLTTVAEFNEVNVTALISQMGGIILFAIALIGLALFVSSKKETKYDKIYITGAILYYLIFFLIFRSISNPVVFAIALILPIVLGLLKTMLLQEKTKAFPIILIGLWLAATAFGFSRGIRFALLMVPAFALAFGIAVQLFERNLTSILSKSANMSKKIAFIIVIVSVTLLLITPFNDATKLASTQAPSMNDAWYGALTKIKGDSSQAIITSWWDFGHWFYAISERSVTFDGAGQGERIHWVGKALLTPDEKEAVGTLRMLNCGQEEAVHVIEGFINQDTVRAVDILNTMMRFNDKKQATKYLFQEGFSQEQIATILPLTYCEDLYTQYFITSQDMISKSGVWGHFGSWDFQRAKMYQTTKNMKQEQAVEYLTQNHNVTTQQAIELHTQISTTKADQWISPWPGYIGAGSCQNVGEDKYRCLVNQQGGTMTINVDLEREEIEIPTSQEGQLVHPDSFVYLRDGQIEQINYFDDTTGFSAIMLESGQIILSHPMQASSMFTKLFYYDGIGLECFEKFDDRVTFSGDRIVTWKVDFSCQV